MDLADLYPNLTPGACTYRLRSMVCAGGASAAAGGAQQAHCALVLSPELKRWQLFEEARLSNLGTWEDAKRKVGGACGGACAASAMRRHGL